jgi:hypothetical protein
MARIGDKILVPPLLGAVGAEVGKADGEGKDEEAITSNKLSRKGMKSSSVVKRRNREKFQLNRRVL